MDAIQDFLLTPPSSAETPARREPARRRIDPREQPGRPVSALLVAMGEMTRRYAPLTDANRAEATSFLKRRHQELLAGWPPLDPPRKKA